MCKKCKSHNKPLGLYSTPEEDNSVNLHFRVVVCQIDDDGGHLIGAQFKGPKDIDNLVPQNSQINRSGGEWFNMETEWANALKETPPKKVTVQINPTCSRGSTRPDAF